MMALYGQQLTTLVAESHTWRASGIIGALSSGEDLEAALWDTGCVGHVIGVADRLW
jgi:hypothetical protein